MPQQAPAPDAALLRRFDVRLEAHVAETPIAHVWRVTCADGTPAALKRYKNGDMQDEAAGFDFLAACDGRGAAQIHARHQAAVLMEWLDGPSLGDLVRDGQDRAAAEALIATANRLHAAPHPVVAGLDPLQNRFQALLTARFTGDCPATVQTTIRRAQEVAQGLLAAQTTVQPLHGDLHHDNVRDSARGYLAFDAKGVLGERSFELANAFRNPVGSDTISRDPAVIRTRAAIWAAGLGVTQTHLLRWAAANAGLALSWRYEGLFGPEAATEVQFIDQLLHVAAQCADG